MPQVRLSRKAREDLKRLWRYVAAANMNAADRVASAILDRANLYAAHPGMGRPRPELGPDIRSFPSGNYMAFYSPIPNGIIIQRVLHGAQDIETEFPT